MLLAKIEGPVVSTAKTPDLTGSRLLLAEILTVRQGRLEGTGRRLVCVDATGAGPGETVLAVQGSSARMAPHLGESPTDAVVVGIVDTLNADGEPLRPAGQQAAGSRTTECS